MQHLADWMADGVHIKPRKIDSCMQWHPEAGNCAVSAGMPVPTCTFCDLHEADWVASLINRLQAFCPPQVHLHPSQTRGWHAAQKAAQGQ